MELKQLVADLRAEFAQLKEAAIADIHRNTAVALARFEQAVRAKIELDAVDGPGLWNSVVAVASMGEEEVRTLTRWSSNDPEKPNNAANVDLSIVLDHRIQLRTNVLGALDRGKRYTLVLIALEDRLTAGSDTP